MPADTVGRGNVEGVEYRETTLVIPAGLTYDDWSSVVGAVVRMTASCMWWLGDLWRYGEHSFGESAAQAFPGGYSIQTLRDAARVAERFVPAEEITQHAGRPAPMARRTDLSFAHHREAAALPPEQAVALLERAAPAPGRDTPRMTSREVRQEAGRLRSPNGAHHEPPRDEGPLHRLERLCREAEERGQEHVRVRVLDVRRALELALLEAQAQ